MKGEYRCTFEPLTIKRMTLRNRIVMPPMGSNFAKKDGTMGAEHRRYYEQRAKGGVGLIIVENACVDYPMGSNGTTQLRLDEDGYVPSLARLVDDVHQWGAAIAIQINHAGASAMASRIGGQPVSASNIPNRPGGEVPRPLSAHELRRIAIAYGLAARRAKMAGFDAVELHAGHSYLLSQFISPTTNDRTDEFGGSPENRARFARMCLAEVRAQVGSDFPISLRISADEFCEGGNTLDDTLEYLPYLDEYVDLYNVSAGLNVSNHRQVDVGSWPDGWRSYLARPVKERFGKPCMVTGNFRDPDAVESTLASGDADLIGMGRGLIADPDWLRKVHDGRLGDIRPCISCNIGCAYNRLVANRPIKCTVNPDVIGNGEGRMRRRVSCVTNVVVVGGGTSGLEAACVAAEAGCTTFLFEKAASLGGMASRVAKLPTKRRLAFFPDYLQRRAKRLHNLHVFVGVEATCERIAPLNPDLIVNATGSEPATPPIPGLAEALASGAVYTVVDLLDHVDAYPADMEGARVAIVGTGGVGLDIAEFFAPRGAQVVLVGADATIGRGLDPMTINAAREMIASHAVEVRSGVGLSAVKGNAFILDGGSGEETVAFDYGFVALGMRPSNPLLTDLRHAFGPEVPVLNIGASATGGQIIDGTSQAARLLLVLEREGRLDR